VWFADIKNDSVFLFDNGKNLEIKIKNCVCALKQEDCYFLLNGKKLICLDKKGNIIFDVNTVDRTSDNIKISDNIYVSGHDTGFLYKYDFSGNLIEGTKAGEHISDFATDINHTYVLTYHENKLILLENFKRVNEISFKLTLQNIIKEKYIYLLAHNGYISKIYMLNTELEVLKELEFPRQIGELFLFKNKLIFSGIDYNAVFTKNLHILSIKKSTGKILCRFADEPIYIFEKPYKYDLINNITYSL